MKANCEDRDSIIREVTDREIQERIAADLLTHQTLSKLNISIDILPQKCRVLLEKAAQIPTVNKLDPVEISLESSRKLKEQMDDEYEMLVLKQKNKELQIKIDRNKKTIDSLKRDLEESKSSLLLSSDGPNNIMDVIRQLKQKVALYEESCEKAKTKFTKLSVPESLYPKAIQVLVSQLAALKSQEYELKEKAEDVMFTKQMRDKFHRLKK